MTTDATGVFDPGLQPERTLLAWRRTCLALGVAAAVAVRFAAEVLGPPVMVLGAVGIATALAAHLTATRRYRAAHDGLTAHGTLIPDGTPLAWLTATLVLTGLASAVFVTGMVLG